MNVRVLHGLVTSKGRQGKLSGDVIPAKAGIQKALGAAGQLDPRLRGCRKKLFSQHGKQNPSSPRRRGPSNCAIWIPNQVGNDDADESFYAFCDPRLRGGDGFSIHPPTLFETFRKKMVLLLFCMSAFSSTAVFAQVPSFEQAYAQELEQLQATRNALSNAADRFEQELAQKKAQLGSEIRQSESELLGLKKRRRALEAKRDRLDERRMVSNDNDAALQALLAGAGESLPSAKLPAGGNDAASAEDESAAFLLAVEKAAAKVDAGSRLHVSEGVFFDLRGREVDGKIVHIGDIAALGVSSTTGGILLKIQGGYRLLDDGPKAQAKRMAAGKTMESVDVFLFSPECSGHDPNKNNGFKGMLNKGGPVAWIIAALALMGMLLVVERLWTLSRQTNWRTGRFDFIAQKLEAGDFSGASTGTRGMGAVGRVLRVLIKERKLPRDDAEKRVSEIILKSMPALERSLTILTVITAVAPLLGLLGTVTGMISTFDVITEFGTGDPKLLSGGISEALITTKLGLAVAVPFLLIRSLMARWSDRIIENMQTYSLAALNIMSGSEAAPAKEEHKNE